MATSYGCSKGPVPRVLRRKDYCGRNLPETVRPAELSVQLVGVAVALNLLATMCRGPTTLICPRQYVPQLRQFVETGLAQQAPDRR